MLRWFVLLLAIGLVGCGLLPGIDPPSASSDSDGTPNGAGENDGGISADGGISVDPPTGGPGAGSGGVPCCSVLTVGGAAGSDLGGGSGFGGGSGLSLGGTAQ